MIIVPIEVQRQVGCRQRMPFHAEVPEGKLKSSESDVKSKYVPVRCMLTNIPACSPGK